MCGWEVPSLSKDPPNHGKREILYGESPCLLRGSAQCCRRELSRKRGGNRPIEHVPLPKTQAAQHKLEEKGSVAGVAPPNPKGATPLFLPSFCLLCLPKNRLRPLMEFAKTCFCLLPCQLATDSTFHRQLSRLRFNLCPLSESGLPFLDCYCIGSLDLNFLVEIKGFPLNQKNAPCWNPHFPDGRWCMHV